MLDRGIAHALAQVTDPIIMVGPELKMVISAVSIGRVAPNDAARRTVLASATSAASIQSIPPGFGTGLPLARAILVSIGGRLEWLSEDEEVGKLLFRFPGASA